MENIIANYGSSSESEDEQVKTPRKLKSYSTEFKLKVAKHAKYISKHAKYISIHEASNKFKVGRSTVRQWMRQKKQLHKITESSPGGKFKKRLPGGGRRLTFNDLDDQLAAWMSDEWFPSPTLNRIAAPFSLSMTVAMLQNAAAGDTFRFLDSFTRLRLHNKQKLLKCFAAITSNAVFMDTQDLSRPESSHLSHTNNTCDEFSSSLGCHTSRVTKNRPINISYRILLVSDVEIAEVFQEFLSSAFHHKPERFSSASPRQCSVLVMSKLSDIVGIDMRKTFAEARRIRLNIPKSDTRMPVPKLCSAETRLMAIAGTRIDALWVADLALPHQTIQPLLLAYNNFQKHLFFGLRVKVRTFDWNVFQAVEIPLSVLTTELDQGKPVDPKFQLSLLLIRPQFAGELSQLLNLVTAGVLIDLFKQIDRQEPEDTNILLPCIELSSMSDRCMPLDFCEAWRHPLNDFSRLSDAKGAPQTALSHLFHYASIQINEKGVSFPKNLINEKNKEIADNIISAKREKVKDVLFPFNHRFDSPFIFMLIEKSTRTALLTGCYAGCPALPLKSMSLKYPTIFGNWLEKTRKRCCGCSWCCKCCC